MKPFFQFLQSRVLVYNLLAIVGLTIAIVFFISTWLNGYTDHGSSLSVPDIRGMRLEKAAAFIMSKNLRYKVADSSIFDLNKPAGTIIEQDPHPNEKVKENRTVYLTITRSTPPGVRMPDLMDVSLKQAEAILKSYGLVRGQLIYIPDMARNSVLGVLVKGDSMAPGTEIPKGTLVDLMLGDGFGNTKIAVPDLFGLHLEEAVFTIKASSLNIGTLIFDESVKDSSLAKVYRQLPAVGDSSVISLGEPIDLFLTQSAEVIKNYESNDDDEN